MQRNTLIGGAIALAVLVAAAVVALRPGPSDEEAVREAIRAVAEGAREADLGATLDPVSDRYQGPEGLTYGELKLFLFREFQRRGPIVVMLSDIQVTLAGDIAIAEFTATLADGIDVGGLDLVPDSADRFHFVADLEREGGDWKIVGSRYER